MVVRSPRTAAQIEADGARPQAAAQQAQLEAWAADRHVDWSDAASVRAALAADEIDAYAADGFMSSTREELYVVTVHLVGDNAPVVLEGVSHDDARTLESMPLLVGASLGVTVAYRNGRFTTRSEVVQAVRVARWDR